MPNSQCTIFSFSQLHDFVTMLPYAATSKRLFYRLSFDWFTDYFCVFVNSLA